MKIASAESSSTVSHSHDFWATRIGVKKMVIASTTPRNSTRPITEVMVVLRWVWAGDCVDVISDEPFRRPEDRGGGWKGARQGRGDH